MRRAKLGLALAGALFLALQGFTGQNQPLQRGAGLRFDVAQSWQGMGGKSLQPGGFGLRAGALGEIEQVGLELAFAIPWPRSWPGRRRSARSAPRGGEFPRPACDSARPGRLAAQRIGLGADLLQHVFEAHEVFLRALEPQLGFVAARMQAANAGGFLQEAAAGLRFRRDDLADWPCRTIAGERAPEEASANRSWTSLARTSLPLTR